MKKIKQMDTKDFLYNKLINRQDKNGHVYNNVLNEAGIYFIGEIIRIPFDKSFTKSPGLNISKAEIDELKQLFSYDPNCNSKMFINIGEKKHRIVHYDGKTLYLVHDSHSGAIVCKINYNFIIGTYDTSKKYKKDGKELNQDGITCKLIVEEAAKEAKKFGW